MKRITIFALVAFAAACAAPSGPVTTTALTAADPATALITGERIEALSSTQAPEVEGTDPVVSLTLRHADGRAMAYQQGNHTPNDLAAQAPGGPLAQVMGLFGEEAPLLYHRVEAGASGAPFICGPEGAAVLGVYDAPDGATQIVGLKQGIEFETRPDGVVEALPYSPDMVCARLRYRRG